MKNIVLIALGVVAGAVAVHQLSKTPQGKQFFDNVDAKAQEFGSAVRDGYKAREEELRTAFSQAFDGTQN